MTLELIETFIKLVEFKNFTKAAEDLCISQSALSHRLNLLEDEVGLKLITRSRGNRSLVLTQAGVEFIAVAYQWLNLSRETQNFKSDYRQRRLSIGSVESISLMLAPFYNSLIDSPNTPGKAAVDIHVFPSIQILEAIENLEIDVGFVAFLRASQNLKIEPIFRERHYLVGNLDIGETHIDPRDLDPDKELLANWSTEYLTWHEQYLGAQNQTLLAVDNAILMASFLSKGTWCVVPACAVNFLKRHSLFYGHHVRIYEMINPPPDRICYKATNRSPRANRIDSIRSFEKQLEYFLRSNNFHL